MTLNDIELDALGELINIGAGRAACSLSEITGSSIQLTVPSVHVSGTPAFAEMAATLDMDYGTTVQQGFEGHVSGTALLAFPRNNAFDLARIVGGIETTDAEMDEELCGILEEIGNIFLNSVLGTIANMLDCQLTYTLPELTKDAMFDRFLHDGNGNAQSSDPVALIADTSFTISSRDISGSLILVFATGDIARLLSKLLPVVHS